MAYTEKKKKALKRGHQWLITPDQYYALCTKDCFYCGKKPKPSGRSGIGVDRINSMGEYKLGNVAPSCGVCNVTKGWMSFEQFAEWAQRLYKNAFWDRIEQLESYKEIAPECPPI